MTQDFDQLFKKKLISAFRFTAEFLNRNHLTWWAAFGTAIGAVRHHNLIPWDDDVDICMPRCDFNKLTQLKYQLEGTDYMLMIRGDDDLFTVESKIVLRESSWQEKEFLHCNTGIYVDIFPLDYIDDNVGNIIKMQKVFSKYNRRYYYSLIRPSFNLFFNSILHLKFRDCFVLTVSLLFPYNNREKYLRDYYDYIQKYDNDDGRYLVLLSSSAGENGIYNKEWFSETVDIPFESFYVKLPIGYHDWLEKIYGDYMQMPPVNKRISRHEQFYVNLSKRLTHLEIVEKVKDGINHEI